MRIVVLGAGRVGSAIARDLAREAEFDVTAVDVNPQLLRMLEAETSIAGSEHDLVVCAVPGHMGFATLESVIRAGKNVVDISFFPEDAFALDALARENEVTAVVDCGVAPGLCNILAGHMTSLLDRTDRYLCYVGGLPITRLWPYEYKAVFSPADVLEEYTRPVHLVEHGQVVVRPALSEVELRDLPHVGTLEAFNTDGLRSLIRTMDIPHMQEKTLRYPGHAALMRVFRDSGFFGTDPIQVGGQAIRPIDLTSALLFEQWTMEKGEEDLTVMQIILEGEKSGQRCTYTYDLFDRYDLETQTTSMARTTGYTCAIVARQVASGRFARKGICPPEYVGQVATCYEDLLREYTRRNIHLTESVCLA
jgi:lysine 6-dehydrogenase